MFSGTRSYLSCTEHHSDIYEVICRGYKGIFSEIGADDTLESRELDEQLAQCVECQDPFCFKCFINDVGSLPGDQAQEAKRLRYLPNNNVAFYQTRSSNVRADFLSLKILTIRALQNKEVSKGIYLNCVNLYNDNTHLDKLNFPAMGFSMCSDLIREM